MDFDRSSGVKFSVVLARLGHRFWHQGNGRVAWTLLTMDVVVEEGGTRQLRDQIRVDLIWVLQVMSGGTGFGGGLQSE